MRRILLAFTAIVLATHLHAQIPAPSKLDMVTTIKPTKELTENNSTTVSDGRYKSTNDSIKRLISRATDIRAGLISGLPPWAESARWDITAKVLSDKDELEEMTYEQRQSMIMNILTDRFKIKLHVVKKELPVYDLVLVKMGPNIKPNAANDPAHPDRKLVSDFNQSNTDIKAADAPMFLLATTLTHEVQRAVIDKTGLKGGYDFHLTWTPDEKAGAENGSTETTPGIVTALQEQLGLKLVPSKGMVDTIVVDSIEHPAED